tara:strand:+ start:1555 stop:1860 length:306 start_codon:yes stop_codon:yes gene_type:complete
LLAKELGMTVRQLLLTIDSKELSEWAGYYSLEPFGSLREHDVPAGIIASTIANCNRAKHSKSFKPEDFMPFYKKESTVMAEDEMKNVMRMMAQKQKEKNNG